MIARLTAFMLCLWERTVAPPGFDGARKQVCLRLHPAPILAQGPAVWALSPINEHGLPTISMSCGFTKQGLPIGMQIIGPPYWEATVLRLARAYEQATDWHNRRPNLD
jgi:Amidase